MKENIQEDQQTPNKMNSKGLTLRCIIIRFSKARERMLKAPREKQLVSYKGSSTSPADFSSELWRSEGSGPTYSKC